MLIDIEKGKQSEIHKAGENALNKRRYTVESLNPGEYLTLHYTILDKMKKNFQAHSRKFYKVMIE